MHNKSLTVVIVALMMGLAVPMQAQDTSFARSIIKALASDEMHGRGASYSGDSIAAAFLRNKLQQLGVEPLADNYYQPYTFNTFSMEGPCWMKVNNRQLKVYDEFRPALWSSNINDDNVELVKVPVHPSFQAGERTPVCVSLEGAGRQRVNLNLRVVKSGVFCKKTQN